ncbi:MAG TPA: extracellular matrix/biofilm biosynthesis regulator RemA family protein [Bacillota bacterium]
MFLHLGDDTLTDLSKIIVIINIENDLGAKTNQQFIQKAWDQKTIQQIGTKDWKSIIITDQKIYLSPISTHTLKKRAGFVSELV